jgi:hypothetical protein
MSLYQYSTQNQGGTFRLEFACQRTLLICDQRQSKRCRVV